MIRHSCEKACPRSRVVTCHLAKDALETCRDSTVALAVLGLGLPDVDGWDLINTIIEERLARRILVVSGRRDHRTRQLLRRPWLSGYFDSAAEPSDRLAAAVAEVLAGRPFFSPVPIDPVVAQFGQPLNALFSVMELQVFAIIGDGSDDQQAATRLGLSSKTVHTYRQRIMRKLSVSTRTDLMRWAIQSGIVRITPTAVFQPGFERELTERRQKNSDRYLQAPILRA